MKYIIPIILLLITINIVLANSPYPDSNPYGAEIHWKLDDDCTDEIAEQGSLTCTNSNGAYSADTVFGSGKSLYYDGTANEYLDSNFKLYTAGYWVVNFWFKADGVIADDEKLFGASNGPGTVYILSKFLTNNDPRLEIMNTQVDGVYNANTSVRSGWNMITLKSNGTGQVGTHVFINGSEQPIDDGWNGGRSNSITTVDLWFLAYNVNDVAQNELAGYIDDIVVWNGTSDSDLPTNNELLNIYNGVTPESPLNVTIETPDNNKVFSISPLQTINGNIWINISWNGTSDLSENRNVSSCGINSSDFTSQGANLDMGFNATFLNNTLLNDGFYSINIFCNKTGTLNGSDTIGFYVDKTNPIINGTFDTTPILFTSNLTYIFNITDNLELSNFSFVDSCGQNYFTLADETGHNLTLTNYTATCSSNPQTLNVTVCDLGNCIIEYYSWNVTGSIDNCSTYTNQMLNWSFYRAPNEATLGDSFLNITCSDSTFNVINLSLNDYSYDKYSGSFCGNPNTLNLSCSGNIFYVGDWTQGWVYDISLNSENYNNDTTYINLTIPKLYLEFSQAVDIQVITKDNVYYYVDTTVLIAMTNLTTGKVSVVFNNGTQFFEYDNDLNTYINEQLTVLDSQDDYLNIKVQDSTFGILSDASTEIYIIDDTNNETNLISTIYGNNEKELYLVGEYKYLLRSYKEGYEQENGFNTVTPDETEGDDFTISMIRNSSQSSITVTKNVPDVLQFNIDSITSYDIEINVESLKRTNILIQYYLNGSYMGFTQSTSSFSESMETTFNQGDELHTYVISINGVEYKRYNIREAEYENIYESSFYETLLTSKLGFGIFFFITLFFGITAHEKHKSYGVTTATIISVLFSFLNLYMLIVSVPLVFGLISKKINGDDI